MPKATRIDDRRTKAGRRHTNGYPHYFKSEPWKDLAQAAYKKQLASNEKTPVSEGLSSTDRNPVRENGLTKG